MTESGVIASFATISPEMISHIVDVSIFHRERRASVAWDYRYQTLQVTSSTEWIGITIPAARARREITAQSLAMACAICKAEVSTGMMSCPRFRTRFHYGLEGGRGVVAHAKMLFRKADDAPANAGKVEKYRAKRSDNQGRGVYSAL